MLMPLSIAILMTIHAGAVKNLKVERESKWKYFLSKARMGKDTPSGSSAHGHQWHPLIWLIFQCRWAISITIVQDRKLSSITIFMLTGRNPLVAESGLESILPFKWHLHNSIVSSDSALWRSVPLTGSLTLKIVSSFWSMCLIFQYYDAILAPV